MFKELVTDFLKQNKLIIIGFIIITLLTFPIESIIIPELYSKLFTTDKNLKKIWKIILIIVGVWIFIQIFYYIKNIMLKTIIPKYLQFVRTTLFSKIIENYETNYKDIETTPLIQMIMTVSLSLKDFFMYCSVYLLPLFFSIFIILIYFFFFDWKIGLTTIILLGIYILCTILYGIKIVKASSKRDAYFNEINAGMNNSFENLMNIYLNNEKNKEINNVIKTQLKYGQEMRKEFDNFNYFTLSSALVAIIIFFCVMAISFYNLKTKKFTLQKFIACTLIIVYFLGYLINVSSWTPIELGQLGAIFNSRNIINSILRVKRKNYIKKCDLNGDIVIKNLSYSYDNGAKIFDNFSFKVEKDEKIGILGKSGSGKTTLIKLLLGFYQPKSGKILINNTSIHDIDPTFLRNNLTYINQRTSLINGTVMDNLKYGNNLKDKEIINILKKYNFLEMFTKFNKGVHTNVGIQGKSLSGGMQKCIINIRGMLRKGNIWVFDEPLAGLDALSRQKMIKMIQELSNGKTLIIITHDKEILSIVNKVINLNKIQGTES